MLIRFQKKYKIQTNIQKSLGPTWSNVLDKYIIQMIYFHLIYKTQLKNRCLYFLNQIHMLTDKGGSDHHSRNIKSFAIGVLILEIIVIVLFGAFVRIQKSPDATLNANKYPAYQDVNVMMLIGFGYLMAFSKTTSWSAFSYTFFMNALMPQLYILLSAFWKKVLVEGFHGGNDHYYIYINEENFTAGLYSAASMFVNIGCTVGRVGPLQIFIMCLTHEVGYTLNEVICYELIHGFDVGGSTTIHSFGAYGGLTISLFLSYMTKPKTKPLTNYTSNIFAFIGCLFLWMYWPSFNFGYFPKTPFAKTQIISHTILSLTGSCLATFMTSAFLKNKFTMEHLLNATLAGGVVIGAPAGIMFNSGGALAIGFLTGIISTLGFQYLTPYLEHKFGIFDTCGVHNLHGIPGILGGFVSAIVAAVYNWPSTLDAYSITAADFPEIDTLLATPYKQGGLQIAILFCSIGIAIVTGIITGLILKLVYSWDESQFFNDSVYFEQAKEFLQLQEFHPEFVKEEIRQAAHAELLQLSSKRINSAEINLMTCSDMIQP